MFFPFGLGFGPRSFPIITILLIGMNFVYSIIMFEDIKNYNFDSQEVILENNLVLQKFKIMQEACPSMAEEEVCRAFDILAEKQEKSIVKHDSQEVKNELSTDNLDETDFKFDFKKIGEYYSLSIKIQEFMKKFSDGQMPEEVLKLDSYEEYLALKENYNEKISVIADRYNLVTRNNISILKLVKATFTHANFMHLIGNIFIILIFGVYVEQRIGAGNTTIIFLVGSIFGIGANLLYTEDIVPVMGASAGATCLIGAFLIFFRKQKMKFIFTMTFFDYTPIFIPVLIAVPVFFLINDALMIFSGIPSNVAHLAHLVGSLVGIIFAIGYSIIKSLPSNFLFEQELESYKKINQSEPIDLEFEKYIETLSWNNQNNKVMNEFLDEFPKLKESNSKKIIKKSIKILRNHYYKIHRDNTYKLQILKDIYKTLDVGKVLNQEKWQNIVQIADMALDKKEFDLAKDLYRVSILKSGNDRKEQIIQTINNIDDFLNPKNEEIVDE